MARLLRPRVAIYARAARRGRAGLRDAARAPRCRWTSTSSTTAPRCRRMPPTAAIGNAFTLHITNRAPRRRASASRLEAPPGYELVAGVNPIPVGREPARSRRASSCWLAPDEPADGTRDPLRARARAAAARASRAARASSRREGDDDEQQNDSRRAASRGRSRWRGAARDDRGVRGLLRGRARAPGSAARPRARRPASRRGLRGAGRRSAEARR